MNINHRPGSTSRSALLLILFLMAVIAFFTNNTVIYAENEGDPNKIVQESPDLDIIIINNKGYKKDRVGPVKFTHKKHVMDDKITCFECHHEYKEGDKDKVNLYDPWKEKGTKKCSECHDPLVKKDDASKLQAAYHLQCKGCHEKDKIYKDKDPSPLAYRKCTPCHKILDSEENTRDNTQENMTKKTE